MSVDALLDKIVAHNDGIVGCIALGEGHMAHNLPSPYDILDVQGLAESADQVLSITEAIEDDDLVFDDMMLGFGRHSVIGRRFEGGVLVIVSEARQRAGFKKLLVGLSLFNKPLARAFADEVGAGPMPPAAAEPAATDAPVAEDAPAAKADPNAGKRRRVYRGVVFYD